MKKKLIIFAVILAAFCAGRAKPDENRYLNMETVTDFNTTETGLMLYTADGSGYCWER